MVEEEVEFVFGILWMMFYEKKEKQK